MPINSFLYPGAKVTPAYEVANSCRFNDGDSAFITRANAGSDGTTDTWTMSMWVKRGVLGTTQFLFHGYTSGNFNVSLRFTSDDQLYFFQEDHPAQNGRLLMTTARKFRDPSAWYHIVAQYDSTQSTNTNRAKIYINGVQETTFNGSVTWPDQNFDSEMTSASTNIHIGKENGGDYFDGYMAEVVLLDGTAASPTSFGEYDEDSPTIFKPKDVSGLTFGTHGFYLDFEDSSNLGNDVNGGTDFTENNLAATDQATDSPTNNFATLNPLIAPTSNGPTFSEGNLVSVTSDASGTYGWGGATTIGVTSGKWYCEAKWTQSGTYVRGAIGVHYDPAEGARDNSYSTAESYAWGYYAEDGTLRNAGSTLWTNNTYATGDIIGVYLDLDNLELYFAKNGTLETGTGVSLTAGKTYHFYQEDTTGTTSTSKFEFNFGAGTSWTVSSGNADANGYGNFEYDPSAGTFDGASKNFYALNTKNLAEFG